MVAHFVKVREKGKKAWWYFLTPVKGLARARRDAGQWSKEDADKLVAAGPEEHFDGFEFCAVPVKAAPKVKTPKLADMKARIKVGTRVAYSSTAESDPKVGEVSNRRSSFFVIRYDNRLFADRSLFWPKAAYLTWVNDDQVEWHMGDKEFVHRLTFLPPLEDYGAPLVDDVQVVTMPDAKRVTDARPIRDDYPRGEDGLYQWLQALNAADAEPGSAEAKRIAKFPDDACYRPALVLPGNLKDLARLTKKDKVRYALDCLNVKSTNKGYRVEVTNGQVMVMVSGPNEGEITNLAKDVPELANCANGASKALIPGKAWTNAFKKLPGAKVRKAKPECGRLAMVLAEKGPTCASVAYSPDGQKVETIEVPRSGDERFPAVDGAWPTSRPVATWRVDADMLSELLAVVADLIRDKNVSGTTAAVTLEFHANRKGGNVSPVTLVAGNDQGQEVRAAFMPLQ